jgi:hypothetical protein
VEGAPAAKGGASGREATGMMRREIDFGFWNSDFGLMNDLNKVIKY